MTEGDPPHIFPYSVEEFTKRKKALVTSIKCYPPELELCIDTIINFMKNILE